MAELYLQRNQISDVGATAIGNALAVTNAPLAWWADVIDEPDYESDYPALPSWADPPTSDDEYDHLGRNVSAQLRRQSLVPWKLVVRGKDYEL